MSKVIRITLIILILTLICCKNNTIHEINDSNFDNEVKDGFVTPWLLIFFLQSCPHCKNANDALNRMSENQEFTDLNVNLGHIDCNTNVMSCMRFNITRVPYIAYVDKNKMFEFENLPTEHSLLKFIKEEKALENSKQLPTAFSYLGLIFKLMRDTVVIANEFFGEFVNNKLGFEIKWTSEYTIALFVISMIIIVVLEYYLLIYCCVKKRKDTPATLVAPATLAATSNHPKND
jgi:hypothetical protein